MKLFLILLLVFLTTSCHTDSDWYLDVQARAEKFGYGYEEYDIITEDGYISKLMRIPYSDANQGVGSKRPILFSHQIYDSGEAFTRLGNDGSPAFYLADQGYDVWLFNLRGNSFSRNHATLNPSLDRDFWEYYLDDVRYDYISCINHILSVTGSEKLVVIAHSFGATTLSISLALEPDYFEQTVSLAILAATPLNLAYTKSPLFTLLGMYPVILDSLWNMGVNYFTDTNPITAFMVYQV